MAVGTIGLFVIPRRPSSPRWRHTDELLREFDRLDNDIFQLKSDGAMG